MSLNAQLEQLKKDFERVMRVSAIEEKSNDIQSPKETELDKIQTADLMKKGLRQHHPPPAPVRADSNRGASALNPEGERDLHAFDIHDYTQWLLELSHDEARDMFQSMPYSDAFDVKSRYATAQDALAMLDKAIEHGVVDWPEAQGRRVRSERPPEDCIPGSPWIGEIEIRQ